jgi:predicted metal-dependent peptidase
MMKDENPSRDDIMRLQSVVRWIEKRNGYIAAAIIRLGRIHFTATVETAGIVVDGPNIHLLFDRKFFDRVRDAELAAVLIHESFHVVFKHQARAELIQAPRDRLYFDFAAEAVINDIITLSFSDFTLPGSPIRGSTLVGCDTSKLSTEQVVAMMKAKYGQSSNGVLGSSTIDDHSPWNVTGSGKPGGQEEGAEFPSGMTGEGWTDESDALAARIAAEAMARDAWGSTALGGHRQAPRKNVRKDLRHFLQTIVRPSGHYNTLWNQIPRKTLAIYPDIILPVYDPENRKLHVLMAVDASGSIPHYFLASAVQVARQRIPEARTTLITFDTRVYEFTRDSASVRGGGGTNVQAVEEYARAKFTRYPDVVIVFSDGETPTPRLAHPGRWIWILPPWGTKLPIAPQSRAAYFNTVETAREC